MITAALSGALDGATFRKDPVFGVEVPAAVPGAPSEVLDPRSTWKDRAGYDAQARGLADMFRNNFRGFESQVPKAVVAAGPA
jgi:phosphoenolpyruvate carboxykinase (ATP)